MDLPVAAVHKALCYLTSPSTLITATQPPAKPVQLRLALTADHSLVDDNVTAKVSIARVFTFDFRLALCEYSPMVNT